MSTVKNFGKRLGPRNAYRGDAETVEAYKNNLYSYNESSGEFNPYDVIDQAMYRNNERGKMAYQEDLAKLLYLAQINQENRMNEYNSPNEQVKRLREAGINPDLAGVDNVPAQNVAGYQGNPMDGTRTSLQTTSDVFGIISSVTSMVSGLVSGGLSIFSSSNALGVADSALSLFQNAPSGFNVPEFIDSTNLSRRAKSRIKKMYNSWISSAAAETKSNSETAAMYRSKGDVFSSFLNPLYNQGIFDDPIVEADAYAKVWKPLIDAQNDFLLAQLKGNTKKSEYDSARYSSELGASENERETIENELFKSLKKPIEETLKNLEKYDGKYSWSIYARAAISAIMLQYLK